MYRAFSAKPLSGNLAYMNSFPSGLVTSATQTISGADKSGLVSVQLHLPRGPGCTMSTSKVM